LALSSFGISIYEIQRAIALFIFLPKSRLLIARKGTKRRRKNVSKFQVRERHDMREHIFARIGESPTVPVLDRFHKYSKTIE
jgi:hypothetical protein